MTVTEKVQNVVYNWTSRRSVKTGLHFLIPSFLQHASPSTPVKIHPTSYLDGLRGIAALVVFFYHFTGHFFKHFIPYYGMPLNADGSLRSSYMIQQPFLRLIFSGRCMVHIFFIVSGYALSLKPLKQIRSRQYGSVLNTLSSSILRRFMRLYLPLYIASFFGLLLGLLGLREMDEPTFSLRIKAWFHAMYLYSDFWNISNYSGIAIDMHLWTIPLEMAFSMVLFAVLIGLSRVENRFRMAMVAAIVCYCLCVGQWAAAEFLMGALLAEVGLAQDAWKEKELVGNLEESGAFFGKASSESDDEGSSNGSFTTANLNRFALRLRDSKRFKRIFQSICVGNLIMALWLMGWPDKFSDGTPSWKWLSYHTPSLYRDKGMRFTQFFWHCISSFQVVFACQQLPFLQTLLTTRVPLYLGKISFALYLTHLSVLAVIGPRVVPYVLWYVEGIWNPKGKRGGTVVYFVSVAIVTMVQVWVADLFWKGVDVRCVKMARKFEEMIGVREEKIPR